MPGIFPDQIAPMVLACKEGRELTMMRWGIPGPKAYGEHPVTNVSNVKSPHWRPWLKPEFRCLVPVSSFSEYADTKPRKTPAWFALDDDRPLFAFAGIWRPWKGVRGTKKETLTSSKRSAGSSPSSRQRPMAWSDPCIRRPCPCCLRRRRSAGRGLRRPRRRR